MKRTMIAGVGLTRFGRLEGSEPLSLMSEAADAALADAGIERRDVDALICGYATTLPHLMLADLVAEKLALHVNSAHAIQMGGATGAAMVMQAADLVSAGRCRCVLVVAGENRLSGQTRTQSVQALAQVGDAEFEVANGATVPGFYGLLASRYLHEVGASESDLAALAVLMRCNAALHPGAHLQQELSIEEVLASRPIAAPLKLLDCCPISDGAAAVIVTQAGSGDIAICGAGQAHRRQHLSAISSVTDTGAAEAANRALGEAGLALQDIEYLGIYDSFTITLAMLLEEIGFCRPGKAGRDVAEGRFDQAGRLPLNLHGGLLSYGHCGVAGGMAHLVEAVRQMRGSCGLRNAVRTPSNAFLHADGGVMSAHVSLVLERVR